MSSRDIDFGGLTLLTENVKIGVTRPGQDSTLTVATKNSAGSQIDRIDWNSETSTLSSNAATLTKFSAVVTTESLTTAAGASQAFTLTLAGVQAGDLAFVQAVGGTNTRQNYRYSVATTTNTVTVTVYNNEPTNALNGTLIFNIHVDKA